MRWKILLGIWFLGALTTTAHAVPPRLATRARGFSEGAGASACPGPRSASELQRRAATLKVSFAAQEKAARELPVHAVSHGVDIFAGLAALLGCELAVQRTYRDGKVQPALLGGLHWSGGMALAAAAFAKKAIYRERDVVPLGLAGRCTIEDAFVLGIGGMHSRNGIGTEHAAGGFGVGLAVMGSGMATSRSAVAEKNAIFTARGTGTLPIWWAVESSWLRGAKRGLALAHEAEALIEAKDLAGAARLLERAEALSKKVARIARTRTADAYPEHVPLGGFDFSPL